MKENKLNILLIIIAFILGLVVMFGITVLTKEKCPVCEKCDFVVKEEEKELSSDEKSMFTLLSDISKKMYEKNEYTNLNKNNDGVYYATLTDIANLNYDVSSLSKCDQNNPFIFFDIDNKMAESYENEPIQVSVSCNLGTKLDN